IEVFKWVTSFLREPQDYACVVRDLAEHLLAQNVVYAEVTLSVGVMLLRNQQPEANFEALLRAAEPFERRGLRLQWVFDAVRQFAPRAAMAVVKSAGAVTSERATSPINSLVKMRESKIIHCRLSSAMEYPSCFQQMIRRCFIRRCKTNMHTPHRWDCRKMSYPASPK